MSSNASCRAESPGGAWMHYTFEWNWLWIRCKWRQDIDQQWQGHNAGWLKTIRCSLDASGSPPVKQSDGCGWNSISDPVHRVTQSESPDHFLRTTLMQVHRRGKLLQKRNGNSVANKSTNWTFSGDYVRSVGGTSETATLQGLSGPLIDGATISADDTADLFTSITHPRSSSDTRSPNEQLITSSLSFTHNQTICLTIFEKNSVKIKLKLWEIWNIDLNINIYSFVFDLIKNVLIQFWYIFYKNNIFRIKKKFKNFIKLKILLKSIF